MNYEDWIYYAINKFPSKQFSKNDAVILLQYITGKSYSYILGFCDTQLTYEQKNKLELLLNRRYQGEPIAYIVGRKEFWSLSLKISSDVFIPRNDTECLIECVLSLFSNNKIKILDLGTGCGAIALALAKEYPTAKVVGIDIYDSNISIAKYNANNLSIKNVFFIKSNWFKVFTFHKFDLIVSNPPYIDKSDQSLKNGDISFEPKKSLISSKNGIFDIELIIKNAKYYLVNNGWLAIEHGWLQGDLVRKLFHQHYYTHVTTFNDYSDNERITIGKWNK